jgi:CBS domain-containing protein
MRDLTDKAVLDVVVRFPKTLGPTVTVADARAAFANHVHMLLITASDGRLLGTLVRDDLADVDDASLALQHAVLHGRTIPSTMPAEEALRMLVDQRARRRAVVSDDGQLLGLLCLKRRFNGFCSDADVLARASEQRRAVATIRDHAAPA